MRFVGRIILKLIVDKKIQIWAGQGLINTLYFRLLETVIIL